MIPVNKKIIHDTCKNGQDKLFFTGTITVDIEITTKVVLAVEERNRAHL